MTPDNLVVGVMLGHGNDEKLKWVFLQVCGQNFKQFLRHVAVVKLQLLQACKVFEAIDELSWIKHGLSADDHVRYVEVGNGSACVVSQRIQDLVPILKAGSSPAEANLLYGVLTSA